MRSSSAMPTHAKHWERETRASVGELVAAELVMELVRRSSRASCTSSSRPTKSCFLRPARAQKRLVGHEIGSIVLFLERDPHLIGRVD